MTHNNRLLYGGYMATKENYIQEYLYIDTVEFFPEPGPQQQADEEEKVERGVIVIELL